MKRTRWTSFALLLGVLLLPLPAMAGGFAGASAEGWAGWWEGLLGWLGLDSSYIDPFGQPEPAGPTRAIQSDSSFIDPNGQPPTSAPGSEDPDSSYIDPDGQP